MEVVAFPIKPCFRGHVSERGKAGNCKECTRATRAAKRRANPEREILRNAKIRARLENLPFDLTLDDIFIPKYCPWLGIPLFRGTRRQGPNSPSLDRLTPARGYVRGNVLVVSGKANSIKQNANGQEVMAVALAMLRLGL